MRRMPEWLWITLICLGVAVVVGTGTYLVTVWYLTKNLWG